MSSVLPLLDDINQSHERIVSLANQLDWDGVNSEWQITRHKLLELEGFPLGQLSSHEKIQAAQQIEKLLELEKQISVQIAPWLEQVRPLLESFRENPLAPAPSEAESSQ